jgi:uncharacterized Zn finger protein (UPF0148 family)
MPRFTVTCPHCQAQLELDAEKQLVVGSKAAERPKVTTSIEDRLQAMAKEKESARAKMDEAMRAERAGSELRDEKFRKLLDGVKDLPIEKPVRDIDLD